jgi:putative solute:sodium symporter small subunit
MATETETQTDQSAAEREAEVDYLNQEVNVFKPSTPFMRDNLKVMWGTFIVWLLLVFGPVTVAAIAPGAADAARIAGTPALFMMTAIGTPLGALLLAALYAYQRDRLDEKYGIEHSDSEPEATSEETAAAADGGEDE